MSEETVTFNLELNVEQTTSEIRRLETLLFRSLGLIRRLSGNEDIDAAINKIQRLVMTIRILHTSLILLMAATTPVSSALALVGVANAAITAGSLVLGA